MLTISVSIHQVPRRYNPATLQQHLDDPLADAEDLVCWLNRVKDVPHELEPTDMKEILNVDWGTLIRCSK